MVGGRQRVARPSYRAWPDSSVPAELVEAFLYYESPRFVMHQYVRVSKRLPTKMMNDGRGQKKAIQGETTAHAHYKKRDKVNFRTTAVRRAP